MYNYYRHILTYIIIKKKRVVDALSFSKKNKCNAFVILCEPRSGSTLLHTYLNSHPQIISHGEVLRENLEKGVSKKVTSKFLDNFIFDFKSSVVKSVGLKFFYGYYKDTAYQKYFTSILQRKDIRIIHLVRKDTLRLFVSLKIAQRTNVWSTSKGGVSHNEKTTVDRNEYLKYAQEYKVCQHEFDELFKHHPCLKISYEDLVDNRNQVLTDVQVFLGVKPKRLFTLLKKQNRDSLESIVLNYDEIKSLLES